MQWVLLVLVSAVFLSLRTLLTKKLLIKNDVLPVLFLVSLFSSGLMLFFKTEIILDFSFEVYTLLLLKSFVITIAWFCLYKAYKHLEVSTVSPLRNLSPIFLIILSIIFLNESITLLNYIGIFILIFSAYALELRSLKEFFEPLKLLKDKFFILIIISLIGNSISAVLDKIIIQHINYYSLLFVFYLFLSLMFLAILLFLDSLKSLQKLFERNNLIIVLLITFAALSADISYFIAVAMPSTLIVLIIPLRRLSTFFSTLIGGRIFRESNVLYKSAVCLVMVVGVYFVII